MATQVKIFPDEPFLIATVEDPPKPSDPGDIRVAGLKFKKERGGHLYRVLDFRKTKMTFDIMVNAMAEERNSPGGAGDPDITSAIVGTTELVAFGAKALKEQKQYGKLPVELFSTVEDALVWIRAQIAAKKP